MIFKNSPFKTDLLKIFQFSITLLLISGKAWSQDPTRVLFIGNSYTYVNDLPMMLTQAANSAGDLVATDVSAPGGHTFQQHCSNNTTLSKIAMAEWDFVVLQEQSQWPSFPASQVAAGVYPYARKLDSIIQAKNPCAETIFYMTWGRKNGDDQNCSSWPPVCTYQGMDSLLALRYTQMANDNDALLSPVGKVWKSLRMQYPTLELYQPDESHPSVAGTYAAACTFYSIIFRKDPTLINWNSSLGATEAANIRNTVKSIVFMNLADFNVGAFDPVASFNTQANGQTVQFENMSANATTYTWDFGDGTSSDEENPLHTFSGNGPFDVTLVAGDCESRDTIAQTIHLLAGISELKSDFLSISPNPSKGSVHVSMSEALGAKTTILICQADGKVVFNQEFPGDKNSLHIDLSGISDGMYYVTIAGTDKIIHAQKLRILK